MSDAMATAPINTMLVTERNVLQRDNILNGYLQETMSSLHHVFGIDSQHKRCNPVMLNSSNILYVTGNCLVQYDFNSKRRRYILGLDGGGIGCFLVDKEKTRVFVGNNTLDGREGVSIFVYALPNFVLSQQLYGGASKGYRCLDLNSSGTKLASISSCDYILTIWDLENGTISLQTKSFGQEVYKVAFSPYDDGLLTTCGLGHVCFWTVAQTFTGLKLQGKIGKFGKVDQSDVDAFVLTSDGKVVTGSESGHVLLWEGGFVKCRFVCRMPAEEESGSDSQCNKGDDEIAQRKCRPLHDGRIYFMRHEVNQQRLITAGADGKIKWWCMHTIETAEVNSDISMDFLIEHLRVFYAGKGIIIGNIAGPMEGESNIIMTDYNGGLLSADLESEQVCKKVDGHGGILVGIDVSPVEHICVTTCSDGYIRCWDYISKVLVTSTKTRCPCSAVRWAPKEIDRTGRTVAVGHATGVLRLFYVKSQEFVIRLAVKPHLSRITCIRFTPDGKGVASASEDRTVFVFRCAVFAAVEEELKLIPVGFIDCGGCLNSIAWKLDACGLNYTTTSGQAVEVEWGPLAELTPCQPETSYALNVVRREYRESSKSSSTEIGKSSIERMRSV